MKQAALVIMLAGALAIPAGMRAADLPGSAAIDKLLADVNTEAVQLKADSEDLKSFAESNSSWQSHADHIEAMKKHVDDAGKLLANLQGVKITGSPWQQKAIDRVGPLLKEMADNLQSTIKHLRNNQSKVHLPVFRDYVNANYDLAADLETLVRDFADYGKAKEKFEKLESKLSAG